MRYKLANYNSKNNYYLTTSFDKITSVNEKFLAFTGYSKDEIIKKDISWLFMNLLKLPKGKFEQLDFEGKAEGFLFTKSFQPREVAISITQSLNRKSEKNYLINEIPNSRIYAKFPNIEYLNKLKDVGIAVLLADNFKLLIANQYFLDYQNEPYNKIENSCGKSLNEICTGWIGSKAYFTCKKVVETGEVYINKDGFFGGLPRGKTYWDITFVPMIERNEVKYIVVIVKDATETVLSREKIEKENAVIKNQYEQLEAQIKIKENKKKKFANSLEYIRDQIHSTLDFDELMQRIIAEASNTLGCNRSVVAMLQGDEWIVNYVYGYPKNIIGVILKGIYKRIATLAVKSEKPLIINDMLNDSRIGPNEGIKAASVKSTILVPLIVGGQTIGVIAFNYYNKTKHFGEYDIEFAQNLASAISMSLQNVKLYEKACLELAERKKAEEKNQWNKQRAEILWKVAEKLLASEKPQDIIEELCIKVMDFLDCGAFFNYLIDEDKSKLYLNASAGVPKEIYKEIEWLDYDSSACGYVALDGSKVVLENVQESNDAKANLIRPFEVRAHACHPIMEQNKVIGTLSFCTKKKDSFNEDELALMKAVADQVAIAISRMRTERLLIKQQQIIISAEREKSEALKKAIEMKDEFLSIISHEFKTPLTVINSAVQAMQVICRNELSVKARGFLGKILQNSNRQLKLVNNLLDVTRMDAGHFKVNKQNIDIVFLTKSIIESIKVFAEQKSINLSFKSDLLKKVVALDEEKYERVLLNLLSNAIKYTPEGKSINVRLFQKKIKRDYKVCVQVIDKGLGIPEDKQELIFERFEQVDRSLSRQAEGTGIGLYLVKMFVEMMDGEITFESKEAKGSKFTIMLPIEKVKENLNKKDIKEMTDNRLTQATAIEFSDLYI